MRELAKVEVCIRERVLQKPQRTMTRSAADEFHNEVVRKRGCEERLREGGDRVRRRGDDLASLNGRPDCFEVRVPEPSARGREVRECHRTSHDPTVQSRGTLRWDGEPMRDMVGRPDWRDWFEGAYLNESCDPAIGTGT